MSLFGKLRSLLAPFLVRLDQGPITTGTELAEFLYARSAYVAQTALFGYLKTRMGTQYREIFQDPAFQDGLVGAQDRAFLHCAADLTVFAVAHAGGALDAVSADRAARALFDRLAAMPERPPAADALAEVTAQFAARLGAIDWAEASTGDTAFQQSPDGVIDAAPVIDGFRETDRLIVTNSVRLRWVDIRRQFRKRADLPALRPVLADLASRDAPDTDAP